MKSCGHVRARRVEMPVDKSSITCCFPAMSVFLPFFFVVTGRCTELATTNKKAEIELENSKTHNLHEIA